VDDGLPHVLAGHAQFLSIVAVDVALHVVRLLSRGALRSFGLRFDGFAVPSVEEEVGSPGQSRAHHIGHRLIHHERRTVGNFRTDGYCFHLNSKLKKSLAMPRPT
jgi:hypothetical protein